MATPFTVLYQRFFRKIEEDRKFFNYFSLTPDEALAVAEERAKGLLFDAIDEIVLRTTPSIDFYDCDSDEYNQFNFDLNSEEIGLISSFMYERYLDRHRAKLILESTNYTAENLRVFDSSNARTTFNNLYNTVVAENNVLLDRYDSKDRETGDLLSINFSAYDSES